jgi:hypothetical protein
MLGCFGIIIMGIIIILLGAKIFLDYINPPAETQIMTSESPNRINKIEFYKVDEFPDPILKIKYGNRYIIKQGTLPIPENISVQWKNDKEADVLISGPGKAAEEKPLIEAIEFK